MQPIANLLASISHHHFSR